MAKLGHPNFSVAAHEIKRLLAEGRRDEAIAKVAQQLRASDDDETVRRIAADLLVPAKVKKRGASRKAAPPYWLEIGRRFDELNESLNEGEAVEKLCDEFPAAGGDRTIRKAIKYYKTAVAADKAGKDS